MRPGPPRFYDIMKTMFAKQREQQLILLINQIRRDIEDPLNLRQLLLYLITRVAKELHLDNILFLLYNQDSDEYVLKESIKYNKRYISLSSQDSLIQYFVNRREILYRQHLKETMYRMEKKQSSKPANIDLLRALIATLDKLEAEVGVPFFRDNELIGVLCVGGKAHRRAFSSQDFGFLERMAEEFSILIQSAMKFEEVKVREKEMTSLYEVGKVISSLIEFKKTFDIIVRNASIILKAPKILVLLEDDVESKLLIKKAFGFSDFQLTKIDESTVFKECTQKVVDTTEGILIRNKDENSLYDENLIQTLGIHSMISTPLFDENLRIIGELRAMRPSTQTSFTDRDLSIASNLANNIIVALNNSRRYQNSEEHLMELSTMYNITKQLTSEFELEKIQEKVCSVFTDMLDFQRSILYLYDHGQKLIAEQASKWRPEEYEGLELDIAQTIEGKSLIEGRIFQTNIREMDQYNTSAVERLGIENFVVLPLLIRNKKPIGVLVIDVGSKYGRINVRLLTAIANQAAVILENARLYKESEELNVRLRKEQTRTAKELQIARYIQQGLLSAKYPETDQVAIAADNIPCRSVGGDFFNFIPYDEQHLGVVVGDVSGKGIPAALLMTMTNSIFMESGKRFLSPEAIIEHANNALQAYLSRSPIFYVTAFYGMIDFDRALFKYCKAGHNPPIFYRAATQEIVFLDAEGTYLGTFEDGGYIEKSIQIQNGDRLILYTDGITEVRNDKKVMFSKERLAELVRKNCDLPVEKLIKFLIKEVEKFGGQTEFADDITLVAMDFDQLPQIKEKKIYKIQYKIKNDLKDVKAIIKEMLTKFEALTVSKRVYNHLRLALSESLMNALEHGNQNDPAKSIEVYGVITDRRVEISVKDEGTGFSFESLSFVENRNDITHRGRGITAIKACMDVIRYNEKGDTITFIKYLG